MRGIYVIYVGCISRVPHIFGVQSMYHRLQLYPDIAYNTNSPSPQQIYYNDTRIQLLDLPGIIEGAAYGRGRGREVRDGSRVQAYARP